MGIMVQPFLQHPLVCMQVSSACTKVTLPCCQVPLWVLGAEGGRDLCLLSCLIDPTSSLDS